MAETAILLVLLYTCNNCYVAKAKSTLHLNQSHLNQIIPSIFNGHWIVLWRHREYRRVAASMLLAVCMKYWPCLKSRSFMPPVMRRHATILYVCKSSQKRKVLPTYSNFQHSDAFWQYFLCTKVTISHRSYFPCNTIFFRYKA